MDPEAKTDPTADENDDTPINQSEKYREELAAFRKQVEGIAEGLLAQVPEKFKALIPEGLDAAGKISWYQKAAASGAFKPVVPTTDKGKPTVTPPKDVDMSTLSPVARIARGYAK